MESHRIPGIETALRKSESRLDTQYKVLSRSCIEGDRPSNHDLDTYDFNLGVWLTKHSRKFSVNDRTLSLDIPCHLGFHRILARLGRC